jgi:hypothetical protein
METPGTLALYTMYDIPTFKTNKVREQKARVHHMYAIIMKWHN